MDKFILQHGCRRISLASMPTTLEQLEVLIEQKFGVKCRVLTYKDDLERVHQILNQFDYGEAVIFAGSKGIVITVNNLGPKTASCIEEAPLVESLFTPTDLSRSSSEFNIPDNQLHFHHPSTLTQASEDSQPLIESALPINSTHSIQYSPSTSHSFQVPNLSLPNLISSIRTVIKEELLRHSSFLSLSSSSLIHPNVCCTSCNSLPIIGVRYKCQVCSNFNLCSACEARSEHRHGLLKICKKSDDNSSGDDERANKVVRLMKMGFEEEESRAMLSKYDYDIECAISELLLS
jgi:hypothetical protein